MQDRGGSIVATITADTTHVIASSNLETAQSTMETLQAGISAGGASQDAIADIHCVSADWISQSVVHKARQPEADYLDAAARKCLTATFEAQTTAAKELTRPSSSRSLHARYTTGSSQLQPSQELAGTPDRDAAGPDALAALQSGRRTTQAHPSREGDGPEEVQPWQREALSCWGLAEWQPPGWTATDWGKDGNWCEPYKADEVAHTLYQLYQHKHRLDLSDDPSPKKDLRPLSASQQPTAADQREAKESSGGQSSAAKCSHQACLRAPVCIVAELQRSMQQYVKGRGADRFRMFGTERAIATLQTAKQPLCTDDDVDALGLGAAPS